jgi:hypothetical protein
MEEEKKSRGVYWFFTAVSITGMVLLLIFQPQWVWISFPFVGTFFANAMNVI